jgi:hypothetical protein
MTRPASLLAEKDVSSDEDRPLTKPIRSSVMYGVNPQLCSAVTLLFYRVVESTMSFAPASRLLDQIDAPFRTSPLVFVSLPSINSQSRHIL